MILLSQNSGYGAGSLASGRTRKVDGSLAWSLRIWTVHDQAQAAVETLAGQGFSNQPTGPPKGPPKFDWAHGGAITNPNTVNGDNYNIARNLMQPMMAQGMDAADIAQWTPALRNAQTSIQALSESLQQIPNAAKGAKMTIDQYNASLNQTAQMEEAMGGTIYGGLQAGLAFGAYSQGMAPGIMGSLMQNQMVTAMAMGQNGVLPSGVANLTGGAQLQAVQSTIGLLGSAFQNLNRNKYEYIPGVGRVLSQSGTLNEAAQVGQTLGITTGEAERLLKQYKSQGTVSKLQGQLGQAASGQWGTAATGIYNFLGKSGTPGNWGSWSKLSAIDKQKATKMWNATAGQQMGTLEEEKRLSPAQVKQIDHTTNIGRRMDELNKALAGPNAKSTGQTVKLSGTIGLTSEARKHFKFTKQVEAKLLANSGGNPQSNFLNSPYGDAAQASNPMSGSIDIGSGAQAGNNVLGSGDPGVLTGTNP